MIKKFVSLLAITILLFSSFLLVAPPASALEGKVNNTSGYKTYLRSGQYPGGFTMYLSFQENYSGSGPYTVSFSQSVTGISDKTLPTSGHETNTRIYNNGTQTGSITSFGTCSSFIGDGNRRNWCKSTSANFTVQTTGSTRNYGNVSLGSVYLPRTHTLTLYHNY